MTISQIPTAHMGMICGTSKCHGTVVEEVVENGRSSVNLFQVISLHKWNREINRWLTMCYSPVSIEDVKLKCGFPHLVPCCCRPWGKGLHSPPLGATACYFMMCGTSESESSVHSLLSVLCCNTWSLKGYSSFSPPSFSIGWHRERVYKFHNC